jgi:hypothetical protein
MLQRDSVISQIFKMVIFDSLNFRMDDRHLRHDFFQHVFSLFPFISISIIHLLNFEAKENAVPLLFSLTK